MANKAARNREFEIELFAGTSRGRLEEVLEEGDLSTCLEDSRDVCTPGQPGCIQCARNLPTPRTGSVVQVF